MRIHELLWPRERIEHIARHGVTLRKLSKLVLIDRWCCEQGLMVTIRSITYLAGPTQGAICFQ